jgi:CAAX prenyl protease-like protein
MRTLQEYRESKALAHVLPLFGFMGFLLIPELLEITGFAASGDAEPWYRRWPEQWLYPVQTLTTLALLVFFWRRYQFRPIAGLALAVLMGVVGIVLWIAPGHLFRAFEMQTTPLSYLGFAPRVEGFNPSFIADESSVHYWMSIGMRFLRMVIVVPLAEEIFWRGFLMRFLVDLEGDYWRVPFGTAHWRSFVIVTAMFTLAHAPVDYFAAAVFGSLMYWIAVRTKSLAACVLMHAVANLLLGLYTVHFEQWGYW